MVALGLAKVFLELEEVRGGATEELRGDAGPGAKEVEAVGDCAEGAAAFAGDLGNGEIFEAVKFKDGVEGW